MLLPSLAKMEYRMNEPENSSRLLTWCGRLALVFLGLVPLSVLGVRIGLLRFDIGLAVFALSCLASLVILMVLAIASLLPKFQHLRRQALVKSLAAVPPVLLLGALLGSAGEYPAIHDVSTDPDDPPSFTSAGTTLRGSAANPVDINPEAIEIQRQYYPDLATLITRSSPDEAFEQASNVAESLDWVIYNSDPHIGVLEASYRSFWFGFVDDIIIRIRPGTERTEVDLRSVSRVGQGDLGANAKRIRAFGRRFEE